MDERYVLDPEHRVTPIDHGEVCLNYDKAWFSEREIEPPQSLDDLIDPRLRWAPGRREPGDLDAGARVPARDRRALRRAGLAGLLAALRENRVLVVDGWEEAYNVRFSGAAGKGDRPIVVSYASSPPAEVIFATPRPTRPRPAVVEDSCFRQIEFAGVLRGARNEKGARELVDFLLGERFQEDIPLSMFVFPVDPSAELPPEFEKFAVVPESPLELSPDEIGQNRDRWVKEWTRHRASLSARAWRALTYGVPLAFLALFFAYPLASILERGLGSGERPVAARRPHRPAHPRVVWFTLWQAFASTRVDDRGRAPCVLRARPLRVPRPSVVAALVTVPFVLPTVVVALAFLAVLPDRPRARLGRRS